jgi:MazG family protein
MATPNLKSHPISGLLEIMAKLRDPETGCPWDVEQDFSTIAPYTIEEAYEVADAVERDHMPDLQDELGDLLLQVVFHARMAEEKGLFNFNDVVASISDKMIRRHPHVFGSAVQRSSETQTAEWETLKAAERINADKGSSVLDDIPLSFPALKRAQKLQKRAASVGFDWPDHERVLDKVHEEIEEVVEAVHEADTAHIAEEIGDLLFVCTNLGRKLKVDVETATRAANAKFERRFRHVETRLEQQSKAPQDTSLDEMEALWIEAKRLERKKKPEPVSADNPS